jgi:hypothetical protein
MRYLAFSLLVEPTSRSSVTEGTHKRIATVKREDNVIVSIYERQGNVVWTALFRGLCLRKLNHTYHPWSEISSGFFEIAVGQF